MINHRVVRPDLKNYQVINCLVVFFTPYIYVCILSMDYSILMSLIDDETEIIIYQLN